MVSISAHVPIATPPESVVNRRTSMSSALSYIREIELEVMTLAVRLRIVFITMRY
jgi:hypothetical protein